MLTPDVSPLPVSPDGAGDGVVGGGAGVVGLVGKTRFKKVVEAKKAELGVTDKSKMGIIQSVLERICELMRGMES